MNTDQPTEQSSTSQRNEFDTAARYYRFVVHPTHVIIRRCFEGELLRQTIPLTLGTTTVELSPLATDSMSASFLDKFENGSKCALAEGCEPETFTLHRRICGQSELEEGPVGSFHANDFDQYQPNSNRFEIPNESHPTEYILAGPEPSDSPEICFMTVERFVVILPPDSSTPECKSGFEPRDTPAGKRVLARTVAFFRA